MNVDDIAPLTERDIAEYLIQNPGFFQRNPELLTELQLGSALAGLVGGNAVVPRMGLGQRPRVRRLARQSMAAQAGAEIACSGRGQHGSCQHRRQCRRMAGHGIKACHGHHSSTGLRARNMGLSHSTGTVRSLRAR